MVMKSRGIFWGVSSMLLAYLSGATAQAPNKQEPLEQEALEQKEISIMGNRGLPKTLFIVPWNDSGSALETEGFESLLDESPEPVDRDVFRRQMEYSRFGLSIE